MFKTYLISCLNRFRRSNAGNIALTGAVLLGVLGLGTGATIDTMRLQSAKTSLQDIADHAALTGAISSKAEDDEREAAVRDHIAIGSTSTPEVTIGNNVDVVFDDVRKVVTVRIPGKVSLFFDGYFGMDRGVTVESSAVYAVQSIDPVTVVFSLDVSGSMAWKTSDDVVKLDALKSATAVLFNEFEEGAASAELVEQVVRTGMSAFNTGVVKSRNLDWGWGHTERAISLLSAEGGTNSTTSLRRSYRQIRKDRDIRAAEDPRFNPAKLREYVVFMTDGDNNSAASDVASLEWCARMKADGMEVFTVAFEAPTKGERLLLECASSADGIEPANTSTMTLDQLRAARDGYFFYAEDAEEFREAFRVIGEAIVESEVRLNY